MKWACIDVCGFGKKASLFCWLSGTDDSGLCVLNIDLILAGVKQYIYSDGDWGNSTQGTSKEDKLGGMYQSGDGEPHENAQDRDQWRQGNTAVLGKPAKTVCVNVWVNLLFYGFTGECHLNQTVDVVPMKCLTEISHQTTMLLVTVACTYAIFS